MIDLHSHYLPGVDDGAPDLDASLALLRAAVADGVEHAVLTPHVFPGRWDNTFESLVPAFEALRRTVTEQGIGIELHLGGEVRLLPETLEMAMAGTAPFLGLWEGQRVMLLELPDGQIPVGTLQAVKFLRRAGIVPLIAHPERNREVMRTPDKLKPLLGEGCLLQLTAGSVTGDFGSPARDTARRLLSNGWVFAVASDAHNLAHRPPLMTAARQALVRLVGEQQADLLVRGNPSQVIQARVSSV